LADRQVALGVIVAKRFERESKEISAELAEDLRECYSAVHWNVELVVDPLVVPPATTTEIFEAARTKLLERDWDLAVVVTDLPLSNRPSAGHGAGQPDLGIAVVSVPALGPVHLRRRLRRALLELVGELVGDTERGSSRGGVFAGLRRRWEARALQELATDTDTQPNGTPIVFVSAVLFGNLRLLVGMVRANRPWRLATTLSRALAAALAAGAFGVVSPDIWHVSAALEWWRLVAVSLLSITITVVSVIAAHRLWEHAPDPRVREQVVLFNVATAGTVTVGILTLYVALFGLILLGAALVITPDEFARTLGHDVGVADYLRLAWFVASLATVGGARSSVRVHAGRRRFGVDLNVRWNVCTEHTETHEARSRGPRFPSLVRVGDQKLKQSSRSPMSCLASRGGAGAPFAW